MTAKKYLKQHGISKETAELFSLTWDDDYLHIPIRNVAGDDLFIKSRYLKYTPEGDQPKYKNSQGSKATLFNFYAVKDSSSIVLAEGECFPPEAEILTPEGWVELGNYKNQKVLQHKENGKSSFVKPIAIIKKHYGGNLVEFSNAQKFYSLTTPEHNLVTQRKGKNTLRKIEADLLKSNPRVVIPRTTTHNGPGIKLTDNQIRLCVAVSADFTIRKGGEIYGRFKKERKIKRIKKLLNTLKIPHKDRNSKGYCSLYIRRRDAPAYVFKLFPHSWIFQATLHQKQVIIEEILYWDGNSVPNRNQIEYTSKEYTNAVFIQTLAHLQGYVSTIIYRANDFGKWYKVSILFGKTHTSSQIVTSGKAYIPYKGTVYCVQVPSGMILVRQKECVSISGNCDAIKLMQEGIPAVSSTGGAGTFPPEFAQLLTDKKIYICYDNDLAGEQGVANALEHLPHAKVIQLPKDSKDICEFFAADHTRSEFLKLMKKAPTKLQWEISHIPEEHTLMDGKEFMSMELKPMPWLIESILYDEGFCFIYGAEGIGKSFIALSIAKAVAEGGDWLDVFKVPKPINVLFLDKENPQSLMLRRALGLKGIPKNLHWLKEPNLFALHNGKGGLSQFAADISKIVEQEEIGLIVIDSFVDLMIGSANSAEDTQRFFEALKQLFPGIAFLVLHHENKPSQGVYRNSGQRLRGSSNINAQTFTMFRLETVAKSKTEMTLEQTKTRDEQKLDKFMIRMDVIPNPDKEGKTTVTGFTYLGVVISDDSKKAEEAEEIITAALADSNNGMSRQILLETVSAGGVSRSTADRTLKDMTEAKTIVKSKKGRESWFFLGNPIVERDDVGGGLF